MVGPPYLSMLALPERATESEPVILARLRLNSLCYRWHHEDCASLELVFEHGITLTVESAPPRSVQDLKPGADYAISVRRKDAWRE